MKLNPNRKVSYSLKEIRKMKADSYAEGQQNSQRIVNLFPLLALRDEFGFGRKRMMQFINKYHEIIQDYNEGYLTFKDIATAMREEIKIDLEDI